MCCVSRGQNQDNRESQEEEPDWFNKRRNFVRIETDHGWSRLAPEVLSSPLLQESKKILDDHGVVAGKLTR